MEPELPVLAGSCCVWRSLNGHTRLRGSVHLCVLTYTDLGILSFITLNCPTIAKVRDFKKYLWLNYAKFLRH